VQLLCHGVLLMATETQPAARSCAMDHERLARVRSRSTVESGAGTTLNVKSARPL